MIALCAAPSHAGFHSSAVAPALASAGKRVKLSEATNLKKLDTIKFHAVRPAETMLLEAVQKKEAMVANVTQEDIDVEM